MVRSDNIYKIKIDNSNNILYGAGTTKFAIGVPNYLQERLYNKKIKMWVETAQLKAVVGSADVGTDYLCVVSNIQQVNTFNNTNNNMSNVLCYFDPERKAITAGTSVISLNYPTEPIIISNLPNVLEFNIADSFTETSVTLQSADLWFVVLVIEIIDEDN